jgi:hypothetical protein
MQRVMNFLKMHQKQMVRPWALSAPILVLLLTIPLVRPLMHPELDAMSDDEQSRVATVQAIVEHHTLAIDDSLFAHTTRQKIRRAGHVYSDQPPMLAALLSIPYWVMHHYGMTFEHNPLWVMFLLTLTGVTIPVALSAGLVYKMGRIFEMSRPRRAILGFAVVAGSGLISYATVLNAHASAATLLIAACACLVQVGLVNNLRKGTIWLFLAGIAGGLSAAIDPPAVIFMLALALVVGAFRWNIAARAAAICVYLLGIAGPVLLHASLNVPVTGDMIPAYLRPQFDPALRVVAVRPDAMDDEDDQASGTWQTTLRALGRACDTLIGSHGVFTHFPVLLMGLLGVTMVMHRHWPASTKMMASVTVGGSLAIVLLYCLSRSDWGAAMFATRWFVLFLPLVLFWSGAWLRRPHRRTSWAMAGTLFAFSTMVSLVGATGSFPRDGFQHYTALNAAQNLFAPPRPDANSGTAMLARQ